MSAPSTILVDTSVWIDFFARSPGPAGNKLRHLIEDSEPVALAGIIVTEILQGLTRDSARIEAYLSQWGILEPDGIATYAHAAGIFRMARSKGLTITTVDALIAALAIESGAVLFTLDNDFRRLAKVAPLKLLGTP